MRRTAPALVTGDVCCEREGGILETCRVCVNSRAEPSGYGDDLMTGVRCKRNVTVAALSVP